MSKACLLSIAGFDPSGGAGLLADIAVFRAHGAWGLSVATAQTAQNSRGVARVEASDPDLFAEQLRLLAEDFSIHGVKIGMLANAAIIEETIRFLRTIPTCPVVLDPVLVSSSGKPLLEPSAIELLKSDLFKLADLITPNLPEAQALTGCEHPSEESLLRLGDSILLKGGHAQGDATDLLVQRTEQGGFEVHSFHASRILGKDPHGTGCALSSAILSRLAENKPLAEAIGLAKDYLTKAIQEELQLGRGKGFLNL